MPKKKQAAEENKEAPETVEAVPEVVATPVIVVTEEKEEPVVIVDVEEVTKPEVGGFDKTAWNPRTSVGMRVKSGEIKHIDQILDARDRILDAEIVEIGRAHV